MKFNIDLEKLAQDMEFDIEDVEMIVEAFIQSSKENLQNLKEAIENNDKEKIAYFAHSIKGGALNLKIDEIACLSKEIEVKAKKNENCDYKSKYYELKEMVYNLKK